MDSEDGGIQDPKIQYFWYYGAMYDVIPQKSINIGQFLKSWSYFKSILLLNLQEFMIHLSKLYYSMLDISIQEPKNKIFGIKDP